MAGNVEDIIAFFGKHGYTYWKVPGRNKDEYAFKCDIEATFEANAECFRDTMSKQDPGTYRVYYQRKQRSGGDFECQPIVIPGPNGDAPATVAPLAAPYVGGISEEELSRQLDLRAKEIENNYLRADLERREKDLRAERKEYEAERNGTLGILVQQIGKVLRPMFPQVAVASTPNEARTLNGISRQETEATPLMEDEAASEKANELVNRFAAVEADWLQLLEAVVILAEQGDTTYNFAKQTLLKK